MSKRFLLDTYIIDTANKYNVTVEQLEGSLDTLLTITAFTEEEAIFITIVCTSGTAPSAKNRFYICNENYQNFIRVKLMCTLVGIDWNTGVEEIRICVDDFRMRNKSNNSGVMRINNKINLTKG